ncbi:MAG: hypothetical protein JKY48_17760 [Flavobacteriales bacterium]|nr:hypothetical protein [Flavobacteriales bacterium]
MNRILFLSIMSLLLLNACEEDGTLPNKGEVITFSASQGQIFNDRTDTFTLISGGMPPYIARSSDVPNAFIIGDTLFFIAEISNAPLVKEITVSDNRGYNLSRFRFTTSPELVNLRVNDNEVNIVTCNVTDSLGSRRFFVFDDPELGYNINTKILTFIGETRVDRLFFEVDLSLGNDPSSIILENYTLFPPVYFKAASSSVSFTRDLFGIPLSINFVLELRQDSHRHASSRERLTIEASKVYPLEIF